MWILCLAEDSLETSYLLWKTMKKYLVMLYIIVNVLTKKLLLIK